MFAFKTLQRRLIVLLVVPVTLFLMILGVFGYRFIQGILFKEWQEIAILRLERAAHQMDEAPWADGVDGGLCPGRKGLPRSRNSALAVATDQIPAWRQPCGSKLGEGGRYRRGQTSAGAVRRDVPYPVLLSA